LTWATGAGTDWSLTRYPESTARVRFALVLVVAAAVAVGASSRSVQQASAGDPGTAQTLFSLTNQDRTSNGLGALAWNANLGSIATSQHSGGCGGVNGRSQDMIDRNYFAHQIPPCGAYVWNVFNIGAYSSAGENIGWNNYPPGQSVGQINTAFMNSPDHRANIMGSFNQMGTGAWAATGPWSGAGGPYNGVIMYTEIFLNGPGGSAPPPPAPRPPAPPRPTGTVAAAPPPAPVPSPSPSPSFCPVPTEIGEADRNSPAPPLTSDGGQPPCPSPNPDNGPSPVPVAPGSVSHEVVSGAERETARQGLLESVIDRVLRLFLNV
jgi:uncharacterized protein YkwD